MSHEPSSLSDSKVLFCTNTSDDIPQPSPNDTVVKMCMGSTFLSDEMNAKYANEKWELALLPTGDMTFLPETIRNNMNQFFPGYDMMDNDSSEDDDEKQ